MMARIRGLGLVALAVLAGCGGPAGFSGIAALPDGTFVVTKNNTGMIESAEVHHCRPDGDRFVCSQIDDSR